MRVGTVACGSAAPYRTRDARWARGSSAGPSIEDLPSRPGAGVAVDRRDDLGEFFVDLGEFFVDLGEFFDLAPAWPWIDEMISASSRRKFDAVAESDWYAFCAEIRRDMPRYAEIDRDVPRSIEIGRDRPRCGVGGAP